MGERIRPRTQKSRNRMRAQMLKRRKKILKMRIGFFIMLIIAVIIGAVLIKKYSPSKEEANLEKYYGITQESQVAVVIDNEIVQAAGKIFDGKTYLEYSVVRDYLNGRFYVDINENILLYTLADGTIKAEVGSQEYTFQKESKEKDYVILKMEGNAAYIALDFVQEYTNMEFQTYEDPERIVIVSEWGEKTVATVRKSTKLRSEGNIKSSILTSLSRKDKVTIIEKEKEWAKVRTKDGFIGYINSSHLKDEAVEIVDRAFKTQKYPNISKNYTINMGWHVVEDKSVNNTVLQTIADTKGLTTISPTWFTVADTDGDLTSLVSSQYVNYAERSNIEVWARVSDCEGGINSAEASYELLSHTSNRENLVSQLIAEVLRNNIDGINVDFENISKECGEHYLQFLRELSVMCRQNGIILSVSNPVPSEDNAHYNLEEQGIVVDYVIIKNYDEHEQGSPVSGPVASLEFVENGIKKALESVPNEKLINAVPFYTRLWTETPKSEEELAAEEGTEAAEYAVKVTSELYRMKTSKSAVENAGAEIVLDADTNQNYAQWEVEGATYKIWLEDETALEAKLQLMKEYKLAGTAAWRLGYESSSVWDLIMKYVN